MKPHLLPLSLSLLAAVTLLPAVASADAGATCVKASEKGLDARDRGALRAARAHFVTCAADSCPKPMRVDCARWLDEVDTSLPSIVVGAKDGHGADLFDVRVKVDGEAVEDVQAGRPLVLDPGPHIVRFERGKAPDFEVKEVKVLLRTGERNRSVVAVLDAPTAGGGAGGGQGGPSPRSEGGPPVAAWVFGGLGVLALGTFGTFAILGSQEKSRLRGACAPGCSDADVSSLKTDYVVADISLGVGIVALGIATYFFLANKPAGPQRQASFGPSAGFAGPQRLARTIWK